MCETLVELKIEIQNLKIHHLIEIFSNCSINFVCFQYHILKNCVSYTLNSEIKKSRNYVNKKIPDMAAIHLVLPYKRLSAKCKLLQEPGISSSTVENHEKKTAESSSKSTEERIPQ